MINFMTVVSVNTHSGALQPIISYAPIDLFTTRRHKAFNSYWAAAILILELIFMLKAWIFSYSHS